MRSSSQHTKFLGAAVLVSGLALYANASPPTPRKAYFTEFKSNSVGVIDTRTEKVIKHIPVPKGAHGVSIIPDGSRVFVSSDESSIISVIDGSKDEVIGTIPTGKQPHGLAVRADGNTVYAAIFGDNQVLEINPATLKVERTLDVANPHNLAPSPDGDDLYVASQKPGESGIADIDLHAGIMKQMIPSKTVPRSINLSPDGSILCATFFDSNEVDFFSTKPLKKLTAVQVGDAPHHVVFTPDGNLVLVVNQVSDDLTLIDAKTRKVVGTIKVGQKPHWIAPTADSKYAYVTDESSNQVSLVDLVDKDVEQTFSVGEAPRKIALQQDTGAPKKMADNEDHSENTSQASDHVVVKIQGPPPRFVPETMTVKAGTTIEWVNTAKGVHTVTDGNGQWDSGSLRPGEKFTRQFSEPGTYPYYCIPHREMGMVGTIVVR